MKKIKLTKGKYALVDDEDFDYINQWKWSFNGSYAVRGKYIGRVNGKDRYERIYLHRDLNKTPKGMETDHINRNKLDNRRCNLRTVTKSKNNNNRDAYKNNICGVCGVNWYKQMKKYCSRIVVNGKRMHLGYFDNLEDAIKARKKAEDTYCAI